MRGRINLGPRVSGLGSAGTWFRYLEASLKVLPVFLYVLHGRDLGFTLPRVL